MRITSIASIGIFAAACIMTMPISLHAQGQRPEVYVGVADNRMDQLKNPDQWKFVRQNADGFYINFIEMDRIYKQEDLDAYAKLFTHKNALIESDMNSTADNERGYIDRLQKAGFTIPYTSLNYGWSKERQDVLKNTALLPGQKPRICLVQVGPWCVGGNIEADALNGASSNSLYRSNAQQADGLSTDGPLGFWLSDQGGMKAGSYSMVKYAHKLGKKALVMLCPYGAGIAKYNTGMFLDLGMSCVREHEDNDADPDIWSVFEYATAFPAVPEQKEGKPFNSTTGMAYYIIKHIQGEAGTLNLFTADQSSKCIGKGIFAAANPSARKTIVIKSSARKGTKYHYSISAANLSSWCDYAAVLKAKVSGNTKAWTLQLKRDGLDITREVTGNGYKFYKTQRLNPKTTKQVELYITRTATPGKANMTLSLELLPHNSSAKLDSLQIAAK